MSAREAAQLCRLIAEALAHAHQHGVVHRDLKTAIILLDPAGVPHIADFGLARREFGEVTVTHDGPFVSVDVIRTGGTIPYMAIDGEENNLYLVNPDLRRLMVSNLVSKRILYEIDVGEEPYWVALMGER